MYATLKAIETNAFFTLCKTMKQPVTPHTFFRKCRRAPVASHTQHKVADAAIFLQVLQEQVVHA